MQIRKPSLTLLAAALLAVSLPAAADWDDRHDDDYHRPRYSQQRQRAQQTNRQRAGYISRSRAANIAARHTRGARVTDVDFTTWRGRRVYEVELEARRGDYEVIVDARTGRVLSSKFDPDD